jgi:hypothetical protein
MFFLSTHLLCQVGELAKCLKVNEPRKVIEGEMKFDLKLGVSVFSRGLRSIGVDGMAIIPPDVL